jgi:anthraniloyl-CoA monooxygenase
VFETDVATPRRGARVRADLVIAADGSTAASASDTRDVRSRTSTCALPLRLARHEASVRRVHVRVRGNARGWFQAHAYRYDGEHSTFIVETPEERGSAPALDRDVAGEGIAFCERLFARYLDGHADVQRVASARLGDLDPLPARRVRTWCTGCDRGRRCRRADRRRRAHRALLGRLRDQARARGRDRARRAIDAAPTSQPRCARTRPARSVEVLKIQNAARNSTEWFENVERYTAMEAEQFTYSLLTRSQRISHENLRLRDRGYVERIESWIAEASGMPPTPRPPMFTQFRVRELTLPNRIVMSPMAMYSCVDGTPDDFYLVHLGSRAHGGAGLVFTEMTCVTAQGRISPGCAGMYKRGHKAAWKRIVDYVHQKTPAKVGMQLGHSGPKGSTQVGWEDADMPLLAGNWRCSRPRRSHTVPRTSCRRR